MQLLPVLKIFNLVVVLLIMLLLILCVKRGSYLRFVILTIIGYFNLLNLILVISLKLISMIYYVDFSFSPFGRVYREAITANTLIRAFNEFKRIHKGQRIFVHQIQSQFYEEYLLLNSKTLF